MKPDETELEDGISPRVGGVTFGPWMMSLNGEFFGAEQPEHEFHERLSPNSRLHYYLLSKEGRQKAESCRRLAAALSRGGVIETTVNGFGELGSVE